MSDTYYDLDDNNFEPAQQEAPAQPQIDLSKYVPIDEYKKLENQFQEIQPKLQTVDRLQQAFSPDAYKTQEELRAERLEQQAIQKIEGLIKQSMTPLQEQIQAREAQELESWASDKGFFNSKDAELWLSRTQLRMINSNDPVAQQLGNEIAYYWNNAIKGGSYLGVKNYVDKNWDKINSYAPDKMSSGVKGQQIGQSFSNQPFSAQNDIQSQIETARKNGNQAEVNRLREVWRQQIVQMGGFS